VIVPCRGQATHRAGDRRTRTLLTPFKQAESAGELAVASGPGVVVADRGVEKKSDSGVVRLAPEAVDTPAMA
jgi:hypothetical protein